MDLQLTQALHRAMRHRPAEIAYADDRVSRSWAEFGDRAARLARGAGGAGCPAG